MIWTVETYSELVDAELEQLPADMRARFHRIAQLVQEFGLHSMREPYVKHLKGPLWEMRMKGKDGIARALYVTTSQRRIIVVRVFVKKTQNTPHREIELALDRAKGIRK